jgi:phthalate 4,5-dioxygenase
MTRRLLLEAVRNLAAEPAQRPPRFDDPALAMVRAVSLTVPAGESWSESGRELMTARLGADFGYTP